MAFFARIVTRIAVGSMSAAMDMAMKLFLLPV
jgi:hypothetical protein